VAADLQPLAEICCVHDGAKCVSAQSTLVA
jgi:hypothetical protein